MGEVLEKYYKRDFWADENLKYAEAHFRLEKSARLLNKLANGKECDLLDVGCGPATLMNLIDQNFRYYGIDMAIHRKAPNLMEIDFTASRVGFRERMFDFVISQGLFEYIGGFQQKTFTEISQILKPGGKFVVTYVNFDHMNRELYKPYNNVQSFGEFHKHLSDVFCVDSVIPTSHHWRHREPHRRLIKDIHMHVNLRIPILSSLFAVEYFFVCSRKHSVGKEIL